MSTLEYALTSWERSSGGQDAHDMPSGAAFVPFAEEFWDKLCVCLTGVLWHCRDMMVVTTALRCAGSRPSFSLIYQTYIALR